MKKAVALLMMLVMSLSLVACGAKADADNWLSKNPQFPTQNNLPPRTSGKPIMTKDAIEETPVSSIDYDDNDALNSIFED